MTIRQLQYFVALAQERHFGRAAQVCCVSQPAFSDAIRKFEAELALSLIRRNGHVFGGLTPEGKVLLTRVKRVLAEYEEFMLESDALREGLSGHIRIGSVPSASTIISQFVTAFSHRCPAATVTLNTKLSVEEILRQLRAFEIDTALVSGEITDSDMISTKLYQERMVLVGSSALLKHHKSESMDWAEAAEYPLAALSHWVSWHTEIERAFTSVDKQPRLMVDTDSVASLYALIRGGVYAAIVPDTWILDVPVIEKFRTVELAAPTVDLDIYLIKLKSEPVRPLINAFELSCIEVTETGKFR